MYMPHVADTSVELNDSVLWAIGACAASSDSIIHGKWPNYNGVLPRAITVSSGSP